MGPAVVDRGPSAAQDAKRVTEYPRQVGFLGDQREQRRLKAVIKRDGALLSERLAAYTEPTLRSSPPLGCLSLAESHGR
jgi:hypothetical protein